MDLKVNDKVKHVAYGFTGTVVSIQMRTVLIVGESGLMWLPRVMATVCLSVAGHDGEFSDFMLSELTRA